jgi:cysteine sulfinate desulfinase/cysteine desulfurase-like protein
MSQSQGFGGKKKIVKSTVEGDQVISASGELELNAFARKWLKVVRNGVMKENHRRDSLADGFMRVS